MRIDRLLADVSVPVVQGPRANPSAFAQGGVVQAGPVIGGRVQGAGLIDADLGPRVLAGLGKDIQLLGQNVLDQEAKIEAKKREQDVTTRAMGLFLSHAQQVEDAELAVKSDPRVDHTTYAAAMDGRLQAIRGSLLEKAGDDPDIKYAAGKLFDRLYLDKSIDAKRHANRLFVEHEKAAVDDYLDTLAKKAAGDPNPDTADFYEGLGVAYLATKRGGVLGEDDIQKKLKGFREKVAYAQALQHVNTSPETFDTGVYRDRMDPARLEALAARADRRTAALAQQRTAEQERLEKAIEKDAERARKAEVDQLYADAYGGRLTLDRLEDARLQRQAQGEDYRRLRDLIVNPKDGASDPDTLARLTAGVHRSTPTASESDLDRAFDAFQRTGRGLNRQDYADLKTRLIARQDHLRTEGRSILNQQHAQAEQVLFKDLGITTPFDQLDQEDKYLVGAALQELTSRSRAFGGKDDPIEVAREIAARLAPVRQQRMSVSAQTIAGSLRFPADTPDAAAQRLETEKQAGRIGGSAYDVERRKILDWQRRAKPTTPPGGGGKSGPNAKPLRTPQTPTVTGRE